MDQDVAGLPPTPVSKEQYNLAKTRIGDDYKATSRIMSGEALADLELRLEKPRSSLLVRYQAQH